MEVFWGMLLVYLGFGVFYGGYNSWKSKKDRLGAALLFFVLVVGWLPHVVFWDEISGDAAERERMPLIPDSDGLDDDFGWV